MKRTLQKYILKDLPQKIVLISGPRQTGKTTVSKQLCNDFDYFNYDSSEDRLALQQKSWNRSKQLIIFDELHKMKQWKRWLKGVFDTEGIPPQILVTGSAKLDIHKRVGDSLAGRYFQYRLHPLDLKEIHQFLDVNLEDGFDILWHCSGFPEPFLKGSKTYYRRWRQSHIDIILRQDLIDLSSVRDIESVQTLVLLLSQRTGSTVSYANLARDLDRDPNTVKRWLQLLENLYIIHRATPYSKNVARSLKKEPKFYFYDHALIENEGARLENIVANSLKKELHFLEDTQGIKGNLHYLRTKDGQELDFLVSLDRVPTHLIEVKMGNGKPAHGFRHFGKLFPGTVHIQVVRNLLRDTSLPNGLLIKQVIPWLAKLSLIE
ncbi:MAG: ATP-binding protein [Chlamydiales bacterium]